MLKEWSIQKMKKSKNARFTEVYNQYHRLVMKIIVNRLGNSYVAEEVVQQVFTSYYTKMDHIGDSIIKPWLIITAKNATVDYLRKINSRIDLYTIDYIQDFSIVAENNVEKVVENMVNSQLTLRILGDVKAMNEDWYNIIVLVCMEGMSQEKAAEQLGFSYSVLRAKLYRARKYIRKKYGDEYSKN